MTHVMEKEESEDSKKKRFAYTFTNFPSRRATSTPAAADTVVFACVVDRNTRGGAFDIYALLISQINWKDHHSGRVSVTYAYCGKCKQVPVLFITLNNTRISVILICFKPLCMIYLTEINKSSTFHYFIYLFMNGTFFLFCGTCYF